MIVITDERCVEYSAPGHPEKPARISKTLERLRKQTDVAITWDKPAEVDLDQPMRAHSPALIRGVDTAMGDFDADTPNHPKIAEHARRSVGGAIKAMQLVRQGKAAFSLLRPPGHHATKDRAMGFCYFNGVAVAALEALAMGAHRVAVFDFDVHHGNGTEAILLDHPHAAFASVHQSPCYPGTGLKAAGENCFNYPLPPRTPREIYRGVLKQALERLIAFKPDLIGVSAGFDAYARDPIAQEMLESEDFEWIGALLRDCGVKFFSVLEGGYSEDLPELVLAYLRGVQGK